MVALIAIITLALVFDFINGFHDAANSIATIVSTRVMSPRAAVLWAAFFNFVAFLVFETHVAGNIAKGVTPGVVTLSLVASGLVGAIVWNLITWYYGLPSSSSHALLGGIAGAAITKAGFGSLDAPFFAKTALFIVVSPVVGLILGFLLMHLVMAIFRNSAPRKVDRGFRFMQLVSASLYSLGHGGNDAQKTMGIIVAALIATGHLAAAEKGKSPHVPLWVVLLCHAAMGLGTMSGGWRIVKTMGMKITKLAPVGGFCAETSGAATLFMATALGIPVSTTHTITGSIVGVGSTRKLSAVRWGVAGRIVWAWVLTVPMAAGISALTYLLLRAFGVPG
ncbi:MAG: inorganic phosphate transporter [Deltaproteobacteria bacterium]|nr:inorganic phosphate transporter [Deltaproteobacteria bacterium]